MRNEAIEYIAHLLLKRAAQYVKSGDYAYCSGDAGIDREAATLLLAGDNLAEAVTHTLQPQAHAKDDTGEQVSHTDHTRNIAIEECARMVDEYSGQSETGDTLTMLAENMRALKGASAAPAARATVPSVSIRGIRRLGSRFVIEYGDGNTADFRDFASLAAFIAERDQAMWSISATGTRQLKEARRAKR